MPVNKEIKDYTLKTVPEGTDQIVIQEIGGTTMRATLDLIHQSKVGFFDYNDLLTATTPISHTGSSGYLKLTNDGTGAFTNLTYVPLGMTSLWNVANSQLDWSELSLGDMIDLRIDLDVTTTTPNQEVVIRIQLAIGGTPYTLELDRTVYKSAGTYKMISYTGFYMGDSNTKDNPAEIQLDTDAALTIRVNGWYSKITRR